MPDFRGCPFCEKCWNFKILLTPTPLPALHSGPMGQKSKFHSDFFTDPSLSKKVWYDLPALKPWEEIDLAENIPFGVWAWPRGPRVQITHPKITCQELCEPWNFCQLKRYSTFLLQRTEGRTYENKYPHCHCICVRDRRETTNPTKFLPLHLVKDYISLVELLMSQKQSSLLRGSGGCTSGREFGYDCQGPRFRP